MQIHELTKRRRPVTEGLWDNLVAAVAATNDPDKQNMSFKDAYAAAKRSGQIEKASARAQQAWQQYVIQLEKSIASRERATSVTEADEPLSIGGQKLDPRDPNQAKLIAAAKAAAAGSAPPAPPAPPKNTLETFRNRTDGLYEKYLKAFVQKNLFSGMPYSRLINAQDVDQIISDMSKPENSSPERQAPFWQELGLQAATAQLIPQSSGGIGSLGSDTTKAPTKKAEPQTSDELVEPVQQAEKQDAQLSPQQLKLAGEVLRARFTNNETNIDSTGDEAVDALLKAMGFEI